MDYIYAKLNEKLAQSNSTNYVPTEIESSNTIDASKIADNEFRLDVRTDRLVRLVQVQGDSDTSDDVVQRFQLYAYNSKSNAYDIPIGDQIVIDHRNHSGGEVDITHAKIAGQQVPAYIDRQGQLVLQYIPSVAILDKIQVVDNQGNIAYQQVESIIDGNDDD